MFKKKNGQISLFFVFIFLGIIVILISAVFAPMMTVFSSEMYKAGEDMLIQANGTIAQINNTEIRTQIQAAIGEGLDATQTNIEVSTDLYQYGWVILLFVVFLVIFILSRQIVEINQQGGVI